MEQYVHNVYAFCEMIFFRKDILWLLTIDLGKRWLDGDRRIKINYEIIWVQFRLADKIVPLKNR